MLSCFVVLDEQYYLNVYTTKKFNNSQLFYPLNLSSNSLSFISSSSVSELISFITSSSVSTVAKWAKSRPEGVITISTLRLSISFECRATYPFLSSLSTNLDVFELRSIIRSDNIFSEQGFPFCPFNILRILNCCQDISYFLKIVFCRE